VIGPAAPKQLSRKPGVRFVRDEILGDERRCIAKARSLEKPWLNGLAWLDEVA
jgi:hypothetical protein